MSTGNRAAAKRARNAKPRRTHRFQAEQHNARISPRKVGLVTTMIQGKRVEDALNELSFDNRRASTMVRKVLQSAVANASSIAGLDPMDLKVVHAVANEGFTLKRFHARGRGRGAAILRRNTHITVAVA
ncbi:MAG: 50S ribosomal protein L22 [Planctomycetota bacterium]|nr:MAG: 50S ribosomal protein L22 [Planctomycetota bacterium]